jgi:hypothetical protein
MKKILISCIIIIALLIGGFYTLNSHIYNEKQGDQNPAMSPKDAIYVIEEEVVMLQDGKAETKIEDSEASTTTEYFGNEASGDLDNDGDADVAFILTQSGGGTGTFYYVVIARKSDNGYEGTNAMFLGDRIAPQSTEIRNGGIIVNYTDRKPGEPFSTVPSVGVSKHFKISGEALIEISH